MTPAGFRYSGKEGGFVRSIPGGRQVLFVALKDYRPAYNLSFTLGVKLDAVEAVVSRFEAAAMTLTQLEFFGMESAMPWGPFWFAAPGTEMDQGFLETGRSQGFWVERPEEMDASLRRAGALVEESLAPFFEGFLDVDSINRAMHGGASRPRKSLFPRLMPRKKDWPTETVQTSRKAFDSRRSADRFMTAIVIASLAGDQEFAGLARRYGEEVAPYGDEATRKFSELLNLLEEERE